MSIPKLNKASNSSFYWRIVVTIICLIVLWNIVDVNRIVDIFSSCDWGYIVLATFLFLLGALGGGIVWYYLLNRIGEKRLTLSNILHLTLVGFVLNNLIPGGVAGDIYRVIGARQAQIPPARSAVTVILERWSSLLALFISTFCANVWALSLFKTANLDHDWAPNWIPEEIFRLDVITLAIALCLFGLFLSVSLILWKTLNSKAEAIESPSKLHKEVIRLGASWQDFLTELKQFRGRERLLLTATLLNMSSPILEALSFYCIAKALGLELSPLLYLAFTPIFRLVSHLPISVNAIGPQEFAYLLLWEPMGASNTDAITISIIVHTIKILLSVIGLPFVWVTSNKLSAQ